MHDVIPNELTWADKVAALGLDFMKLPQTECPVEHIFEGDTYIREMRIPAGTMFLGRGHRYGHECQLVEGSIVLIAPEGKWQVDAPFSIITTPGYHMVLYAITDVVGRTIHPANGSRDVEALEADIFDSVAEMKRKGHLVTQQPLTIESNP